MRTILNYGTQTTTFDSDAGYTRAFHAGLGAASKGQSCEAPREHCMSLEAQQDWEFGWRRWHSEIESLKQRDARCAA